MSNVTKSQFVRTAGTLVATVNGASISGPARMFSSGSMGWNVNGKARVKVTPCPKDDFGLKNGAVSVVIAGQTLTANPKVFSSGSVGWYCNGKVTVGDYQVQVGLNLTVVKSKEMAAIPGGEVQVQVGGNATVVKSKDWPTGDILGIGGDVTNANTPAPTPAPAPKKVESAPPAGTVNGIDLSKLFQADVDDAW